MKREAIVRYWFYLALSLAGLTTAMVFNGLAVTNGENYTTAWFGSAVDWVLSADLSIVAVAVVVWMFAESKRLGMRRVWVYILLSGVTAMAFTFPLFLAIREKRLADVSRQ
jgi:uncharacterized membrane protein